MGRNPHQVCQVSKSHEVSFELRRRNLLCYLEYSNIHKIVCNNYMNSSIYYLYHLNTI